MAGIVSFDSILLATDGSEYSEGAVREAINLAEQCKAKLTAVTAVDFNPEFEALAPNLFERMEAEAKSIVDSVKSRAEKENIPCDSLVISSFHPYEAIVEEAVERKADAIVMGRRGRTGLKRLLMGSVTARVIGHSPVNVLVVPKDAELKFKKILIATDGSRHSETAARGAMSFAKCAGCGVVALSVVDEKDKKATVKNANESVKRVKKFADKEGVVAETMVEKGRADDAIVRVAKKKGCDLIVLGSHGRTGIKRLLMGSVAERVVGHASCAVLIVKP